MPDCSGAVRRRRGKRDPLAATCAQKRYVGSQAAGRRSPLVRGGYEGRHYTGRAERGFNGAFADGLLRSRQGPRTLLRGRVADSIRPEAATTAGSRACERTPRRRPSGCESAALMRLAGASLALARGLAAVAARGAAACVPAALELSGGGRRSL